MCKDKVNKNVTLSPKYLLMTLPNFFSIIQQEYFNKSEESTSILVSIIEKILRFIHKVFVAYKESK